MLLTIILSLQAEHAITLEYLKNHTPRDLSCLELTVEQNNKINKILIDYKKTLLEFNDYKKEKEILIKNYIKSKNFDKDFYFSIKSDMQKKGLAIETNFFDKIFKILDDNQKEAFLYFLEEWRVE